MLDYDADGTRTENGKECPANKANIGSALECLRNVTFRNDRAGSFSVHRLPRARRTSCAMKRDT
ncbi:hypothetical protein ALC62_11744 [Cyphomyrmex costatus]|uniref:Uncharacterized protein n=1 Tax=Cyphomyrmex costatus TaxID=456900 RepID=A0A195C9F3_9HYME|nr:hypothetical protein ALC62_11744 [Cyphomyrmex costatus]